MSKLAPPKPQSVSQAPSTASASRSRAQRKKHTTHWSSPVVNNAAQSTLQRALEVSKPEDEDEQEADAVASEVMRKEETASDGSDGSDTGDKSASNGEHASNKKPISGVWASLSLPVTVRREATTQEGEELQREPEEDEEKDDTEGEALQRAVDSAAGSDDDEDKQTPLRGLGGGCTSCGVQRKEEDEEGPDASTTDTVQAALVVGRADDPQEREADDVAERVMRMEDSEITEPSRSDDTLRRAPTSDEDEETTSAPLRGLGGGGCTSCGVQRKEDEDEERDASSDRKTSAPRYSPVVLNKPFSPRIPESTERPRFKPVVLGGQKVPTPISNQIAELRRNGGSPLPRMVRRDFEQRFGQDFSQVRVHDGDGPATVAQQLRAKAFTLGKDVVFGRGHYRPETETGKRLLAHELTHVVQQSGFAGTVAQRLQREADSRPAKGVKDVNTLLSMFGIQLTALDIATQNALRALLEQELEAETTSTFLQTLRQPAAFGVTHVLSSGDLRLELRVEQENDGTISRHWTLSDSTRSLLAEGSKYADTESSKVPVESRTDGENTADKTETPLPESGVHPVAAAVAAAPPASEEAKQTVATTSTTLGTVPVPPATNPDAKEGPRPDDKLSNDEQAEAGISEEENKASEPAEERKPATDGEPKAAETSPKSPDEDPAFQSVTGKVRDVSYRQGHNTPAQQKAMDAQRAAQGPANETDAQAKAAQVAQMDAQEPAPFDKAAFVAALRTKIFELTPKNLKEARDFKANDGAGSVKAAVKSQVDAGAEAAGAGIEGATNATPDPSVAKPKEVSPLPPTPPGPKPEAVGAEGAAPKPRTDSEVTMVSEAAAVDEQLTTAGITDQQLANSNEPAFLAALDAKETAKTDAKQSTEEFRAKEQTVIQDTQKQAVGSSAAQTGSMHGARATQFVGITSQQSDTKSADEQARARITSSLETIYTQTKADVDGRLSSLDERVNSVFDRGAEQAKRDFEERVDHEVNLFLLERYLGSAEGLLNLARDLFLGLPPEVNDIYTAARNGYIRAMDQVIDEVADVVGKGLTDAKKRIAQGMTEVRAKVAALPEELRQLGTEAVGSIQGKFDALRADVDAKRDQLIDQLAQKYVDNLKAIDDDISARKERSRGLIDRAAQAVGDVIETLRQLKDFLLGVLADAAAVVDQILSDPITFLGNLVSGIKAGLGSFVDNIGTHLKTGLMEWLLGSLAGAGIQLPENFDLQGILSLAMQMLGLTYQNIRAKAVNLVGEPVVVGIEQTVEIFKVLMTEGPAGAWQYIKDQVGDIVNTVLGGIRDFVIQKIVMAGIGFLLSLLSPASAFVRAVKMLIDVVMFFINRGQQIISLVQAITGSLAAIASGNVGALAAAVESALAKAIPVALGFLASLLGVGGIAEKIKEIIGKIQAPINRAIDWLIQQALKLFRKVKGAFSRGKPETPSDRARETEAEQDPQKAAKVEAGLTYLHQQTRALSKDGAISRENAEKAAAKTKANHPVFKSVTVSDGGEDWDFKYTASPEKEEDGPKKLVGKMPLFTVHFLKNADKPAEWKQAYDAQLSSQQNAINAMKVGAWHDRRSAFNVSGRDPDSAEAQRKYRDAFRERMLAEETAKALSFMLEQDPNQSKLEAKKKAAAKAEETVAEFMKKNVALHDPDQIAGGTAKGISGMGLRGPNSSIGSQWKHRGLAQKIEDAVVTFLGSGGSKDDSMNVALSPTA